MKDLGLFLWSSENKYFWKLLDVFRLGRWISWWGHFEVLIGPLQFTITLYRNRHAGEQTAHWDIENKVPCDRKLQRAYCCYLILIILTISYEGGTSNIQNNTECGLKCTNGSIPHWLIKTSVIFAVEMSRSPLQSDSIIGQMNKHTTSIITAVNNSPIFIVNLLITTPHPP